MRAALPAACARVLAALAGALGLAFALALALALVLAPRAARAAVSPAAPADAFPDGAFAVLCYHDVRDRLAERPDAYTLETGALALQFAWLRARGYHVIDFGTVLAAQREHRPLPPRAVLLSFDDGLASVYTRVLPLLEAFHYPAIVGLVGDWLRVAGPAPVHYPDAALTRADFLTPAEIAEMQRSGLIEFASHTQALHEGISGNPQGNEEPAATTHRFDAAQGGYESDAAYRERVRGDLTRSSADIVRLTGVRPRIVIWPYGAHNHATDTLAAAAGMPYGMTLELGFNTPATSLASMHRILVTHDFTAAALARALEEPVHPEPVRAVEVALDAIHDADPAQQEAHLSLLLDQVQGLGVNTVYLQAVAPAAPGSAAVAAYFPNRHLPMRADLFNRVAWQLRTRTGVAVYAELPVGGYRLGDGAPASTAQVREIYADLATYAAFQGVLLYADPGEAGDASAAAAGLIDLVRADHDDLRTAWRAPAHRPAPEEPPSGATLFDRVAWFTDARDGRDRDPARWLLAMARRPDERDRTVLMLPAADPNLAADLVRLRGEGALNLGFYPEDPLQAGPLPQVLRPVLSLKSSPDD
jgi:biofilm PGA synthesis lipoprotein PgaB